MYGLSVGMLWPRVGTGESTEEQQYSPRANHPHTPTSLPKYNSPRLCTPPSFLSSCTDNLILLHSLSTSWKSTYDEKTAKTWAYDIYV